MQGSKLTGSTGFASWIGVESVDASGKRTGMNLFECGFSEPNPI